MLIKAPYLLLIAFILLQSCSPKVEQANGYTIKGKIEGIDNGKALLAKLDLITNERIDVDSTDIINGNFTFTGTVQSPYLHTVFINGSQHKIHLFLENSPIDITGKLDDLKNVNVAGSREDSLFHSYATDDIFDRTIGMDIMLNYPNYSFAAFTAYYQFQIHNIHGDTLDHIINSFEEPVKQTVYYEHLTNLYTTLKRVAISQPAPKFAIPDTKGDTIRLEDFKGKYVLIDFWASWCAPCRSANPDLVKTYNRFSDNNFTIVGISVDKSKDKWLHAITADGLPWVNLSNLQGWSDVSSDYGVKAVPQNFLLDPGGIIIDKNIEPEQLIERLDEVLLD